MVKGNPVDDLKKMGIIPKDQLTANDIKTALNGKRETNKDAKPLKELVVSERFTIEDIIVSSSVNSFTPVSERRYGGRSPSYNTGFSSNTVLSVRAENENVPVKKLVFSGYSALKTGDYISATIPRGEETYTPRLFPRRSVTEPAQRQMYIDRPFKEEEKAIELQLLSKQGTVMRTERAVDYEL